MLNFEKTYKMVLTDDEGNTYKSDNARLMNADIHSVGPEELYAEILVSAPRFMIEMNEAGMAPEMPLAAVAAKATKIIQEEKRKTAIEREWKKLVVDIYHAIKQGRQYILLPALFKENKIRLEKKGYKVIKEKCNSYEWEISWMEPEFQV